MLEPISYFTCNPIIWKTSLIFCTFYERSTASIIIFWDFLDGNNTSVHGLVYFLVWEGRKGENVTAVLCCSSPRGLGRRRWQLCPSQFPALLRRSTPRGVGTYSLWRWAFWGYNMENVYRIFQNAYPLKLTENGVGHCQQHDILVLLKGRFVLWILILISLSHLFAWEAQQDSVVCGYSHVVHCYHSSNLLWKKVLETAQDVSVASLCNLSPQWTRARSTWSVQNKILYRQVLKLL